MSHHPFDVPQFYLTAPSPCPYLKGQRERKVFTHLVGSRAPALNELLTQGGFRRSQNIAYRPACESCRACVTVRVLVEEFERTRGFRRVMDKNSDLVGIEQPPGATQQQYTLFRRYLDARHGDGGMVDMSMLDYAMMVEDTHIETKIIEYRLGGPDGELMAVALTDVMSDGLSMVYSFYEPDAAQRSIGTYMILDHIERARRRTLPYVYLGYWVEGSQKMDYKRRFRPQELLMPLGWERAR